MARPLPLDLYAEATTADGTRYKFDANQPPASRLTNFSFGTKIGEGFSDGSGQLGRRIDQDYADLNLVDAWTFTGADGSVAYEGRVAAMPRDLGDTHSISVTLAGWMAHAKDRMFQEIYVDRDAGQWGDMPLERKAAILTTSRSLADFSYAAGDTGGLVVALPNQAIGGAAWAESWYKTPPGCQAAMIGYKGTTTSFPAGWAQQFFTASGRDATGAVGVTTTLDGTLRSATTTAQRYAAHQTFANGSAATPAAGANLTFTKLAVYGNHGLTPQTGDPNEPAGLYVSDILKNVAARFCPMLNTSGVQTNTYVVQHAAYRDPITPYDVFLDLNKYALWHLGVWDNRTLTFRPYDFSDYDWEIRTDDPGTTFSPQGPSTDSLVNGIAVTYTDPLTGVTDRLTPDIHPELRDLSATNPWNTHGLSKWGEITLSTPTLAAQALLLGQAALADNNRPKTPGTITVRGYIRDRAGNPQPCWKVRAGDMIAITNFPNDTPRLIVETSYDDTQKQVQISIDRPMASLDAYLARRDAAAGAAGF